MPASLRKYARRSKVPALSGTEYTIGGYGKDSPVLVCRLCGEFPPIKSNLGIHEELLRITRHFSPAESPSCPEGACVNHGKPVAGSHDCYYRIGKTDHGSQRYKCRACGKTFSEAARSTLRQRQPQKNLTVLRLLMNKSPMSRICEVAGIAPKTFYNRLDFFHRQALAFAGRHELQLFKSARLPRLYIAVDRQDYTINWSGRKDKRNVVLRALGSASLESGYVFGMDLNFVGDLEPAAVERDAVAAGDYSVPYPFRRHARLWLEKDYRKAVSESATRAAKKELKGASLSAGISGVYADVASRDDVESPERVSASERFPILGMQVHSEYTMYAHFYYLRQLFRGVDKVRFYMDQESGIRAACLAAFEREIRDGRCEAFYVRLGGKDLTVDEKRKAIAASRAELRKWQDAHPALTLLEVETLIMRAQMAHAAAVGKWSDRWCVHPFPNNSEPEKAMCHLTDFGQFNEDPSDPATEGNADHLARLYLKASLHPIDRFFMQVRRRISLLERPIGTSSKAGRTWHGYSAYRPENIEKVLTVFRVFYNYCLTGKDGKTPAMRLGLVNRVMRPQDVLSE